MLLRSTRVLCGITSVPTKMCVDNAPNPYRRTKTSWRSDDRVPISLSYCCWCAHSILGKISIIPETASQLSFSRGQEISARMLSRRFGDSNNVTKTQSTNTVWSAVGHGVCCCRSTVSASPLVSIPRPHYLRKRSFTNFCFQVVDSSGGMNANMENMRSSWADQATRAVTGSVNIGNMI
jgi:hypothetical protein